MSGFTSIKQWDEEDRPREKLLLRGLTALKDSELIALLIGSGTRDKSAVEVGQEILNHFGGLEGVARCDVKDLTVIRGIGEAKAITVVAAFELARRKQIASTRKTSFASASEVAAYVTPILADKPNEVFYALFLNQSNRLIYDRALFEGGVSASIVDVRILLRDALNHLATGIVICHNHPSGVTKPSPADVELTNRIRDACNLLDIRLMDHIIVGGTAEHFFSFRDNGLL